MRKLLRANLARLLRDRAFLLVAALMLLFGIFNSLSVYAYKGRYGNELAGSLNEVLFSSYMIIGFAIALVCGLYVGVEYGEGTLRNKLATGARRESVYLANALTCALASLSLNAAYLVGICAAGLPTLGPPDMPPAQILHWTGLGMLCIGSFSALFTLIPMLVSNRTISAVACLLVMGVMFLYTVDLYTTLNAPEFYENLVMTEGGEGVAAEGNMRTETVPNPDYIRPEQRPLYETLLDLLPMGQAAQLGNGEVNDPWRMVACSALVIVLANGAGVWAFRRKDLK